MVEMQEHFVLRSQVEVLDPLGIPLEDTELLRLTAEAVRQLTDGWLSYFESAGASELKQSLDQVNQNGIVTVDRLVHQVESQTSSQVLFPVLGVQATQNLRERVERLLRGSEVAGQLEVIDHECLGLPVTATKVRTHRRIRSLVLKLCTDVHFRWISSSHQLFV